MSLEDDRFLAETRQGKMRFYAETGTQFFSAVDKDIKLLIVRDSEGQPTGLVVRLLDGQEIRAQRVR